MQQRSKKFAPWPTQGTIFTYQSTLVKLSSRDTYGKYLILMLPQDRPPLSPPHNFTSQWKNITRNTDEGIVCHGTKLDIQGWNQGDPGPKGSCSCENPGAPEQHKKICVVDRRLHRIRRSTQTGDINMAFSYLPLWAAVRQWLFQEPSL